MTRTVGDIPTGGASWPKPGKIEARCYKAEKWVANTGTKAVKLWWSTEEGHDFTDSVFVTIKAMGRLSLVAQRVCAMPKNFPLPDDDAQAAAVLAKYILENAIGRSAILTIEEQKQEFIHQDGPDVGKKDTKTMMRVAFSGYDALPQTEVEAATGFDGDVDAGVPF